MITKKRLLILLGALCIALCILFVLLALPWRDEPVIEGGPSEASSRGGVSSAASSVTTPGVGTSSADSSSEAVSEEPEPYFSPVDFETLWERCEDIYAWLEIPGADISYPVAQSQTDDSFYLTHNIDGKSDKNGTLYTEHAYNALTFGDPVTIIYGHNMRSGLMFGFLQEQFSDKEWFDEHQTMTVYLPDRELHYRVFAAVPYGKEHIMYKYQSFREPSALADFLESVNTIRKLGANYNKDCTATEEDRVLVLSTCLPSSSQGRYLVLAKLEEVVGEQFPAN